MTGLFHMHLGSLATVWTSCMLKFREPMQQQQQQQRQQLAAAVNMAMERYYAGCADGDVCSVLPYLC